MRSRRRPIIIALVFLSSLALGAIGLGWIGRALTLAGQGASAVGTVFGGLLAGVGAGALGFTALRRPPLVWASGLLFSAVGALPFTMATLGAPMPAIGAAVFGGCVAAVLVGATQSLDGLEDTPGQDLAQVLGVGALGAALGLLLPQAGLIAAIGYDGLARGAGFFAAGSIAFVVLAAHRSQQAPADLPLGTPPPRVVGQGAVLGAAGTLWAAVLGWSWGSDSGNGALVLGALIAGLGVVIAIVAGRSNVDVDLAARRSLSGAAFVLLLVAALTPRLPAVAVFGTSIVRQVGFAWLAELAVRAGLMAACSAPLLVLAGISVATSARQAVRTPSNAGRWIAGQAFGAAAGVWLAAIATSESTVEWVWIAAAAAMVGVTCWHWRELRLVVVALIVGLALRGWSTELWAAGSATEWNREAPRPEARSLDPAHVDVTEVVAVGSKGGQQVLRVGGHLEATTGKPSERALIGVHAALLSSAGVARRALVVGVAPGIVDALKVHGVGEIELVAPDGVLDAAGPLGVSLDGVTVHRADPRAFLERSSSEWDLIVLLPPRPGAPSARGLFTLEAWKAAKAHLSPAGQLVQRLDTWAASTAVVKTTVRTLRVLFPHGTTWGGAGEICLVMSDVAPVLAPPRLAARLEAPTVKKALGELEVGSPAGLLAWQLHSSEGQVRFAGPGHASIDRRPLIELGMPVASFLDEAVDLGDERTAAHPELALTRWAEEVPLTARDLEAIHRALARHYARWHPVVRASAENWLALAPTSTPAAVALVRAQLAQNDLSSAIAVLDPRLRVDDPPPPLVAAALDVLKARVEREGAIFRKVDAGPLRALAKLTLARHPEHEGLRAALASIEGLP